MKYIVVSSIFQFIKNNLRIIILFFIVSLCGAVMLKVPLLGGNTTVYDCLGIVYNLNGDKNILVYLITLFNLFICIFICIKIFTFDLDNNICNIFFRLSPSKWIFVKMLSIIIITLIMRTILFMGVYIIYNFNVSFIDYIYVLFTSSLFVCCIQFFSLLLYITNSKIIFSLVFLILIILIRTFNISIKLLNSNGLLIGLIAILIILIIIIIFKQIYVKVFERIGA